jgi:hypothetical protein
MPIRIDADEDPPPVTPGTNEHELLAVLADHPDMGFSPRELAEMTEVSHNSVHKTLARLREKGLVRNIDSHWALAEDVASSTVATLVSLGTVEEVHGDDAYGEDDDWAADVPDLGENA